MFSHIQCDAFRFHQSIGKQDPSEKYKRRYKDGAISYKDFVSI